MLKLVTGAWVHRAREFLEAVHETYEVESALHDIARIRDQLAASTRFQGFAPSIVAMTGGMAALLAGWQSARGESGMFVWIMLAVVSVLMIGTEAVIRARWCIGRWPTG